MLSKVQLRLYILIVAVGLIPTIGIFLWGVGKAIQAPEFAPRLFVPMQ